MECQDEMVEMDSQEAKEKRETLVCRDHLVCRVRYCNLLKISLLPFMNEVAAKGAFSL